MGILIKLVVNSVAVLASAYLLKGVRVDGFFTALVVSIVLGIVNAIIKPVLVLLTLPLTILTLGLFLFVINALMILLVDKLVPGFDVASFWWALGFSLVLSIISAFLHSLI